MSSGLGHREHQKKQKGLIVSKSARSPAKMQAAILGEQTQSEVSIQKQKNGTPPTGKTI